MSGTRRAVFADTTPYFVLSPEKRAQLEAEAKALRAEIGTKNLNAVAKTRAELRLREIEHLLAQDGRGAGLPAPAERNSQTQGQQCRAGETFTTPGGDTYEHQCTCGRHVEVLNAAETAQRAREAALEDKCKRIAAHRARR